jgi:hypothetical protein
MNAATREPPNPNPTRTRMACSRRNRKMSTAPSSPKPTVNIPEMVPAWNATSRASLKDRRAALATRTLPCTAEVMPT